MVPPSWPHLTLITSWKPHLQMPPHWGLGFWREVWRHTSIQSSIVQGSCSGSGRHAHTSASSRRKEGREVMSLHFKHTLQKVCTPLLLTSPSFFHLYPQVTVQVKPVCMPTSRCKGGWGMWSLFLRPRAQIKLQFLFLWTSRENAR